MTSRRATTIKQTQASITAFGKIKKPRKASETTAMDDINKMNKIISKQKGTKHAFQQLVAESTKSKSGVEFTEPTNVYPQLPSDDQTYNSDNGQMSDSNYDAQSDEQVLTSDPETDYASEQDNGVEPQIEQEQMHFTDRNETIGITAVKNFQKCENPIADQLNQVLTKQQLRSLSMDIDIAWLRECKRFAKDNETDINTLLQTMKYSWVGIQLDSSLSTVMDIMDNDRSSLAILNRQTNKLTSQNNKIETLTERYNETVAECETIYGKIRNLADEIDNEMLKNISDQIRETDTIVKIVQNPEHDNEISTNDFNNLPGNAAVLVHDATKANQVSEAAKAELEKANAELRQFQSNIGHSLQEIAASVEELNERQQNIKTLMENIKDHKKQIPDIYASNVRDTESPSDIPKHELEATLKNLDSSFNALNRARMSFTTFRGGRQNLQANVKSAKSILALAEKIGSKFNYCQPLNYKVELLAGMVASANNYLDNDSQVNRNKVQAANTGATKTIVRNPQFPFHTKQYLLLDSKTLVATKRGEPSTSTPAGMYSSARCNSQTTGTRSNTGYQSSSGGGGGGGGPNDDHNDGNNDRPNDRPNRRGGSGNGDDNRGGGYGGGQPPRQPGRGAGASRSDPPGGGGDDSPSDTDDDSWDRQDNNQGVPHQDFYQGVPQEPRQDKRLAKLPAINARRFFWNGNTSTLSQFITKWDKMFSDHADNQSLPLMYELIPSTYHYILEQHSTFQDFLQALGTLASSEAIYTQQIITEMKSTNPSKDLHDDRKLIHFYMQKIAKILEIEPYYHMTPTDAGSLLCKFSNDVIYQNSVDCLEEAKKNHSDINGAMNYLTAFKQLLSANLKKIDHMISLRQISTMYTGGGGSVAGQGNQGTRNVIQDPNANLTGVYNLQTVKKSKNTKNKNQNQHLTDPLGQTLYADADTPMYAQNPGTGAGGGLRGNIAYRGNRGGFQGYRGNFTNFRGRGNFRGNNFQPQLQRNNFQPQNQGNNFQPTNQGVNNGNYRGQNRPRGNNFNNFGYQPGQSRGNYNNLGNQPNQSRGNFGNNRGQAVFYQVQTPRQNYPCLVCQQTGHSNLIECPRLPEFIPSQNATSIHANICKLCLATTFYNTANCKHRYAGNYFDFLCQTSNMNFLLCNRCPGHSASHTYFKTQHDPSKGFNNYVELKQRIGARNVIVNLIRPSISGQSMAARFSNNIKLNDTGIGMAACPSELVHVQLENQNYKVQVFYDTGSQITLCSYQCGPLVMGTRKTTQPISIHSVTGVSKQIRQIHALTLGNGITTEAILIPNLDLRATVTKVPDCWTHLKGSFASQHGENQGTVGQVLLGADCNHLFPDDVYDEEGNLMMTQNCRLKISIITGKYIIFGEGRQSDQQLTNRIATTNMTDANLEAYDTYWPHLDDLDNEDLDDIDQ